MHRRPTQSRFALAGGRGAAALFAEFLCRRWRGSLPLRLGNRGLTRTANANGANDAIRETLHGIAKEYVLPESVVFTDEFSAYRRNGLKLSTKLSIKFTI